VKHPSALLPPDIRVFERGWLSSNNILLLCPDGCGLIDSGYASHAAQTVALVAQALQERPLDLLINTHLHSDHCGGNAALQARFPDLKTCIPPGQAEAVRHWDAQALSYAPTGQTCPPFSFNALLRPGSELQLGLRRWQVHGAPGHDPHAVVLFEPELGLLVSADALWQNGFGVVFPEIEGEHAFDDVAHTLDLIESLHPRLVIPGHGTVFSDVAAALQTARQRLERFVAEPRSHARYAAKVLLKFKLLELQRISQEALRHWAGNTPYFSTLYQMHFSDLAFTDWIDRLIDDLIRSGAAQRDGPANAGILSNLP
jgi:glyoxylase-like metal-dependent hydrolase (beta-lactamase superfamily II)